MEGKIRTTDIVEAYKRQKARPKTWAEVTDEDIVAAVQFAAKYDKDGIARSSSSVLWALSQPTPEQWPDAGPNSAFGLGLIPAHGEGSGSPSAMAPRLRRLVDEGRLEKVPMVHPRGKPAPPGFRVIPYCEKCSHYHNGACLCPDCGQPVPCGRPGHS